MGNTYMWEEQFRGAPTIYALFHDLMNTMGLGPGAKVLFGGCSAGARGAMVHLDNIVTWMDGYGIEVRGLLDSGLWVDVEPVSDTGMGGTLLNQAADVYGFANVSSVIPDDCADAYPGEEYKCACRGVAGQRERAALCVQALTHASCPPVQACSGSTACRS